MMFSLKNNFKDDQVSSLHQFERLLETGTLSTEHNEDQRVELSPDTPPEALCLTRPYFTTDNTIHLTVKFHSPIVC